VRVIATKDENDEKTGRIGYKPVVSLIQEGVAFQVTPISNVSGRTVLLDVHSRVLMPEARQVELKEKLERANAELSPKEIAEVIDERRFKVSRLSTTLRVPVNRPMLVGGMSMPGTGNENLYLFVKVSVQELRNDQEEEAVEATPDDPPADDSGDADPSKKPQAP
jgi:hypothetical protein